MEGPLGDGLEADFEARRGDFRLRLDISVPQGRTLALLGPNGAGKSTAVAAISGLLPVERGRIRLDGVTLDDPATRRFVAPEEREVGVVFQDFLLFPHLTVLENVAFGLRSRGRGRLAAISRAAEWLEKLDLGPHARKRPDRLSGGEAQRVALARALAIEPDLLLLDEPLSALDAATRTRTRRGLSRYLQGFPGPRVLITHDPVEAFLLADEIHVIEDGAVIQAGTADEIRLRPRSEYVAELAGTNLFIGTASPGQVLVDGHRLQVVFAAEGEALVTIRPTAVSLHRRRPEGSARNTWETVIEVVEPLADRARVRTGEPLPLTVEITTQAAFELELKEGDRVWVAIKATEIGVEAGLA